MSATDQEIVEAVLAGEQHRYAELVQRYQGKIVSYVMRMMNNYDDAVDLSQEVFLKAYTALDSYRPQYPFTAWLFRIARNASIDELRRRRLTTVSLDAPVSTEEGEMHRDVESDAPGPESTYLEDEARSTVEQAISELPDKYREPLVLRHAAEMSYEEISEALELPLGTVKTRIFRAREALRSNLERLEALQMQAASGAEGS
ncbi:MAG: sigma-70 family RNA polymerase sigma factor [Acidobacteria bacterium]|nr:sigma-70 family RNA polymerase sigma factor [Acidobacteriota bacterium]